MLKSWRQTETEMEIFKSYIKLQTVLKMLKHRWVIFIPSVLNAHKFTVNICNEILVYIDVELSSQAQEVLWCKSGGMLFHAVGWNGFTRVIGFSLNGYKTTRAWVRNVSAGHQLCGGGRLTKWWVSNGSCTTYTPDWQTWPQGLKPRTDCHLHHSIRGKLRTCRQDCDPGLWIGQDTNERGHYKGLLHVAILCCGRGPHFLDVSFSSSVKSWVDGLSLTSQQLYGNESNQTWFQGLFRQVKCQLKCQAEISLALSLSDTLFRL